MTTTAIVLCLLLSGCARHVEPAPRVYGIIGVSLAGPERIREGPTCVYKDRTYRGDKQMCTELKAIIELEMQSAQ